MNLNAFAMIINTCGGHQATRRAAYATSLALVILIALWTLNSRFLPLPGHYRDTGASHSAVPGSNSHSTSLSESLAASALEKVLLDAAPIFGLLSGSDPATQSEKSTWMARYPDDTSLVDLNIPGAHDAATWNYSKESQKSLNNITDLANLPTRFLPADFYRCQRLSLRDMLDSGIRAFDLRFAFDVTNTTIVFWHGFGLQSQTATIDSVLFGFYYWLDQHPSETVFLSFQREHPEDSVEQQLLLFNALMSHAASKYMSPFHGFLGTLGQARGKIILLRRFDLDLLPSTYDDRLPGLHFSPSKWTVNGDDIEIMYNTSTGAIAQIEDYYAPETAEYSDAQDNILSKYNTTIAALERAASQGRAGNLAWSFASSTNIDQSLPKTPLTQALGNGTSTPDGGVNDLLLRWFKGNGKGQRYGIVMFDFFDQPGDLIDTFLSVAPHGGNR